MINERLDELFRIGYAKGVSDRHLMVGSVSIYRINGQLIPTDQGRLMAKDTYEIARSILMDELWEILENKREVDLSCGIEDISRYCMNIFGATKFCLGSIYCNLKRCFID